MYSFISSTYRDLRTEREAAQAALREGESLPWGMEFFVSEPRRPLDVCLRELERCDAVILLVGARAGSLVPDGSGSTYTQAEIRHALQLGRPLFTFLQRRDGAFPNDHRTSDPLHDKLEKFLAKYVIAFESNRSGEMFFRLSEPSEETFGKEFAKAYSRFEERHDSEQYPQALRDLRALVQESMEIVCEKKNIDITKIKKRDIGSLSDALIKHNVIDGKLNEWFRAFSSVANLASHKEYPSEKDLRNYYVKEKVRITILLGAHLIYEMEKTIAKRHKIRCVSAKDFKIKIIKGRKRGKTLHQSFDGIDNSQIK